MRTSERTTSSEASAGPHARTLPVRPPPLGRSPEAVGEQNALARRGAGSADPPDAAGPLRVLLVEDSAGDASLVTSMLQHESVGADVHWVRSLVEAERALRDEAPALVLADLGLPDAHGADTVAVLVQAVAGVAPVVVLTGDDSEDMGRAAIRLGAHDYLHKSRIDQDAIARCVRFATSSRSALARRSMADAPMGALFGSDAALAFIDASASLLEVNAGFEQLTGFSRADVLGTTLTSLAAPCDREALTAVLAPPPAHGSAGHEVTLHRADGGEIVVALTSAPVSRPDEPACWAVLLQDLTEQHRAQQGERLRSNLLDAVAEAVLAADRHGRLTYLNHAAERLHGVRASDVVGTPLAALIGLPATYTLPEVGLASHWPPVRLETRVAGEAGDIDLRVTLSPTADSAGVIDGWTAVAVDLTEHHEMQRRMEHQALHDSLTGLPNRTLLMDRLSQGLARAQRGEQSVAVLVLDLDNFKTINDTYGHDAGDEVLRTVGQMLEAAVRPGDTVARLGGDEFVLCCEGVSGHAEAQAIAGRVLDALSAPLDNGDRAVSLSTSIGVQLIEPGTAADPGIVLRNADAAMHHAKTRGRRRVEMFSEELRSKVRQRARLREELLSVTEEQIEVHYQPQVRLTTGELIGFEALVRWEHPEFGTIPPSEFIPAAEETAFVLPLGRLVLQRAVGQLAEWRSLAPEASLVMSVNLSARQLTDATLPDFLSRLLQREGVPPRSLCLEITETVLMDTAEDSVRQLTRLKACGVQLAIDDFGTGYSSLAYLRRFPLDMVKIDREFVTNLGERTEDSLIVASVVRLADSLGLHVLAEGVETVDQRDELLTLGCELAQGFLWSRPRPAAVLEDLVRRAGAPVWDPARPAERRPGDQVPGAPALGVEEVASVLRHEIANPVTIIQSCATMLQQSLTDTASPSTMDLLQAIGRSTETVQALIASLTDLRLIGTGAIGLSRTVVDLACIARTTVDDLSHLLRRHPTSVVVERGASSTVIGDPVRLRQVVHNLVANAARHTPPGTTVEVTISAGDGCVTLAVADDGPGIPAERAGMLFRKFSRLRAEQPGTGLGLFLSRGLAQAHQGTLRYRPRPAGGSVFVLSLPQGDPADLRARS